MRERPRDPLQGAGVDTIRPEMNSNGSSFGFLNKTRSRHTAGLSEVSAFSVMAKKRMTARAGVVLGSLPLVHPPTFIKKMSRSWS